MADLQEPPPRKRAAPSGRWAIARAPRARPPPPRRQLPRADGGGSRATSLALARWRGAPRRRRARRMAVARRAATPGRPRVLYTESWLDNVEAQHEITMAIRKHITTTQQDARSLELRRRANARWYGSANEQRSGHFADGLGKPGNWAHDQRFGSSRNPLMLRRQSLVMPTMPGI